MRLRIILFSVLIQLSFLALGQAQQLTAGEVRAIIQAAVTADSSNNYYVVVVDRAGRILGAWQKPNATAEAAERALSLARTGAYFSNDQAPLASRTVRFISGIHFQIGRAHV